MSAGRVHHYGAQAALARHLTGAEGAKVGPVGPTLFLLARGCSLLSLLLLLLARATTFGRKMIVLLSVWHFSANLLPRAARQARRI